LGIIPRNRTTMRCRSLFIAIAFNTYLFGQNSIEGNYYAFDTISKEDSIKFSLQYFMIGDGSIKCLIFPIAMIEADWANSDFERFNFKSLDETLSGQGKIFKSDGIYNCNILLANGQDFFNNTSKRYLKELFVSIRYLNDSTLYVNSKVFKKDSRSQIFQRFTGY
jgi:hypothetical protein